LELFFVLPLFSIVMKHKWVIDAISAALVLLLVYAASGKLMDYPLFVAQLHTHPYLKPFAGFLAWSVPAVELIISMLMIIPRTRLTGLYAAAALLFAFTAYLVLMLLSGKDLPCSCSGIISSMSWGQHIVFNIVFMLLAIFGIWFYKRKGFYKGSTISKTIPIREL
jgi:uncharacterized membrane protein YphA (DoxX/SURF4 family)